jgi:L-alanine-DL-glutamate epimerase-like enolase superfamily enzyme
MAAVRQMPCTVHLSGGFGFVYSLHFAAVTTNIGDWQEYKQGVNTYGQWFDPPLRIVDGAITIPTGPGVGIVSPRDVWTGAEIVRS